MQAFGGALRFSSIPFSWGYAVTMSITLDIPEEVLSAIPGNTAEVKARLRLELACALYQGELASFGSAAQVAGLHPFVFGHELTRHGIKRHYGEADMADDSAYVAVKELSTPT